MTDLRRLWWAIQVNAAMCFLLLGYIGVESESVRIKVFVFLILISAAVVEYLAYKSIYRPHIVGGP
jgi:hypothetical protein